MSNRKAPRQANIELLRVVSMLAVIAMHFLGVVGVMTSLPDVMGGQMNPMMMQKSHWK